MAIRKGIHHVAMNVRDLDETIRFYEALGCMLLRKWPAEHPDGAMLDAGGAILEIFSGRKYDPEAVGALPHVALASDDVDGDLKIALENGAKPYVDPKDIEMKGDNPLQARIAFFIGLSGEMVELFDEK